MTSIVGIYCRDGVVIGADSAVTMGDSKHPTIEQTVEKLEIFDNKIILAGTGSVGINQRCCIVVEKTRNNGIYTKDSWNVAKEISHEMVEDAKKSNLQTFQGFYSALIAYPSNGSHHLFDFSGPLFQPEKLDEKIWFCSKGCVSQITDSFLAFLREIFWKETIPNINDGIFATVWTLEHAINVNAGGVNGPIRISILEKQGVNFKSRFVEEDELLEHDEYIKETKGLLTAFRNGHKEVEPIPTPDVREDIPVSVSQSKKVHRHK
jgi:hypothetical protein